MEINQAVAELKGRVETLEDNQKKMHTRQDKLEELHHQHREEFIETRTYVRESYNQLKEIRLGIDSLTRTTGERIEQQGKYYREELRIVQDDLRAHKEVAAGLAATLNAVMDDRNDDSGSTESSSATTLNFAWKVIAGVLALATAVLGLLQVQGG